MGCVLPVFQRQALQFLPRRSVKKGEAWAQGAQGARDYIYSPQDEPVTAGESSFETIV